MTYNGLIGCLVASILGFRFHYEFRPLDQLTIRMQLQSSCRDIIMRVSDILMRVSECYTFELAIITRSRYKRAALFTNGIISFTSVLQYLSKTVTMVHTSKVYKYASYEEYRDNGMFSSEANCMQFLYDLKILRTNYQCPRCRVPMAQHPSQLRSTEKDVAGSASVGRLSPLELEVSSRTATLPTKNSSRF